MTVHKRAAKRSLGDLIVIEREKRKGRRMVAEAGGMSNASFPPKFSKSESGTCRGTERGKGGGKASGGEERSRVYGWSMERRQHVSSSALSA